MITLITGNPGAGKTLYCLDKLVIPLIGATVEGVGADGQPVTVTRRILTNIPGFCLDHELIGPDVEGLSDWHKWCRPGDVIVFDECQRPWPKRANGSKVADCIAELETHRHYGIDFILLTQNPPLLDQNVCALVGAHLHVRRFGKLELAVVYEWDHCSRSLMYAKAIKKSPYVYNKAVYKLYKSSALHTKPRSAIPTLVYFVIAGLVGAAALVPMTYDRIANKTVSGSKSDPDKPPTPVPAAAPAPAGGTGTGIRPMVDSGGTGGGYDWASFVPRVGYEPRSAPAYDSIRQVVSMPRVVGGYCVGDSCTCYAQRGAAVMWGPDCHQWLHSPRFDPFTPDRVYAQADPLPLPPGAPANP